MKIVGRQEIEATLTPAIALAAMREALLAQARGECDTPMPMHLELQSVSAGAAGASGATPGAGAGEVHIKASSRRGGACFALKMAGAFPERTNGMMLLVSAASGEPLAYFADEGYLTDLRTAAVAALVARELGRSDRVLGILGSGVQAGLTAELHAAILPLEEIVLWGRSRRRAAAKAREIAVRLPQVRVEVVESPGEVAERAALIVTATASRAPLLRAEEICPGTHLSAVGSDSPGKQELDPEILRRAALLLVDSRRQCERLGELQHAPAEGDRALEIGTFLQTPTPFDRKGITVADFTGLGVEDLYIAEACFERLG